MLWIDIKRIVRSGFVDFWRNGFVSFAAVLVMTVTLFVLGAIIFIGATLETSLNTLRDKVDVNVYFVTTAAEDEILALKASIEQLPEVKRVEYISREEALARFEERHKNDQLTLQALEELGENPLGASLNIKATETAQYEGIAEFLQGNNALGTGGQTIIDKVNYLQNKTAIDKLGGIINASERFGFSVMLILAIASILITFNTIRLAIYTARDEISVMRLVGASNFYIRGPFVFEGVMYGVISAFITLLFFYPLTYWLGPVTESFFGGIQLFSYYLDNFASIFALILGTGIVLGGASSFLAVKRYLKV
jgi:cell division transport system permease protein